jgi:hypothetical protein
MRPRHAAIWILLPLLAVGCTSQNASRSVSREDSRLRWMLKLYLHASQQGRAPESEVEFKKFIAEFDSAMRDRTLAGAGVDTIDELFVSERDGLPYAVIYGEPPKGIAPGLAAYEQQGVDGRRYVGYALGIIEEVDEQRFDTLVPKAVRNQK